MAAGVINYPTALDDANSLIEANNQASSTITDAITSTTLSIPVADPSEFPASGLVTLTDSITPWTADPTKVEILRYASKSGANLIVSATSDRGLYGTSAQSWDSGSFIGQRITARHHTVLAEALIAVETKLGIGADTPGGSAQALLSDSSGASNWRAIAQADVTDLVTALAGKAATSHTHAQSDITGLSTALAGKADVGHTHEAEDITDFASAVAAVGVSQGYLTGNETITLSGDLSGSGATAITATIANDAVTYAKLQNISATQRVLGRNSSGAGDTEEVTASQLLDWLGSTRGALAYRGESGWAILAPGASGDVLTSNGAGADPSYETPTGGGGGASTALDNLASVAINTSLISDTDNTDDLGSASIGWKNLFLKGFARLSGTDVDSYATPVGNNVPTKIAIPTFDPGSFGQIVAFGLGSGGASSARALSLFDQRGAGHQPTLQIFDPAEQELFGLTWDGSTTKAQVMSSVMLQLTASRVISRAPSTAPTDSDIPNGYLTMRLDESADEISIRVRYSDGTLATGTITLTLDA